MKYLDLLVSSPSSKSNLLTILLEVVAEFCGAPGLGLAIGWSVSAYFEQRRTDSGQTSTTDECIDDDQQKDTSPPKA